MSQSSISGLSDVDAKHKMEWDKWVADNFDEQGNLKNQKAISITSDSKKQHEIRDATF